MILLVENSCSFLKNIFPYAKSGKTLENMVNLKIF